MAIVKAGLDTESSPWDSLEPNERDVTVTQRLTADSLSFALETRLEDLQHGGL